MIVRTHTECRLHLFTCLAALLVACLAGCVRIPPETLTRSIDAPELSDHVHFLAQPALGGRKAKTIASAIARDYISSRFKAYGLVPWGEARGYGQGFGLGTNVVGVLPGCDPEMAKEFVLVSAHYDHVGREGGKLYPGAADNASGVSAILEIAERLSLSDQKPRRSVCFAAFDTEESGMLGAYAFTCRSDFDPFRIAAVVNVDMLGGKTFDVADNTLLVGGTANYPDIREAILKFADQTPIRSLPMGNDLMGPSSDHVPFEPLGMPCLFFTSGYFTGYHTVDDTADKLDYELVRRSSDLVCRTVEYLATCEGIAQPVRSTAGDPAELRAIRDLLQEVAREREVTGLTDAEVDGLHDLARRADELLDAGTYTREDRRRFVWELGPVVMPVIMKLMKSGDDDPLQKQIHDSHMLVWHEFCATHRDFAVNTFRKGMGHYLKHRPGLFRRMPPLDLSGHLLSEDDLRYAELGDGRYRLSLIVWDFTFNINMTCRHISARGMGHDCTGQPGEIVDYALLCWQTLSMEESFGRVWDAVLERVCGEDHGDEYETWLAWRLGQAGHEDKDAWIKALRECEHKKLAWKAKHFCTTDEILIMSKNKNTITCVMDQDGNAHLENVGRQDSRKALDTWIMALSFKPRSPDQCDLDPTFPFYDHPAIRASRLHAQQIASQERPTLNKVAEAKLKELTGQDFGDDADAWREWVKANWRKR